MCTLSTKIFCQIVYEKKNIQLWGLWCRRLSFRRTKQYCVLSRFQNTTKSLASHREHPTTCKYIVLLTTYRILSPIFWAKSAHLQWAKQAEKCANLFWIKTFGLYCFGCIIQNINSKHVFWDLWRSIRWNFEFYFKVHSFSFLCL